jgi:hypothetical protein
MSKIVLSPAQERAIRNARLNSRVGVAGGLLVVAEALHSGDRHPLSLAWKFIVGGATAKMLSELLFPVQVADILTFE